MDVIYSKKIDCERKVITVLACRNERGDFLRITEAEKGRMGHRPISVVVPVGESVEEFDATVSEAMTELDLTQEAYNDHNTN